MPFIIAGVVKSMALSFLGNSKVIEKVIILLLETLKIDFQIKNPKIIISGINPHAGENGDIGNEEILYIKPAIKKLLNKGISIDGPFSADSIFSKNNLKKYDCFICNYHDQALIPFKIISGFNGINYTGSLDIIRVSPDHGVGQDIMGKKIANPDSLIESIKFFNCIK